MHNCPIVVCGCCIDHHLVQYCRVHAVHSTNPYSCIITAANVLSLVPRYPDPEPIRRGIKLIVARQQANGDWPQASGSFPFNC